MMDVGLSLYPIACCARLYHSTVDDAPNRLVLSTMKSHDASNCTVDPVSKKYRVLILFNNSLERHRYPRLFLVDKPVQKRQWIFFWFKTIETRHTWTKKILTTENVKGQN
jgi:hypothetical protein